MLHVPPRHQPRGTVIKAVLRGGLFCCLSARSVRRLYMPVFLFLLVPFLSTKRGKKKYILFYSPFYFLLSSSHFPVNWLPSRYLCATLRLSFRSFVMART
jgi:hypothetical protein